MMIMTLKKKKWKKVKKIKIIKNIFILRKKKKKPIKKIKIKTSLMKMILLILNSKKILKWLSLCKKWIIKKNSSKAYINKILMKKYEKIP
jgi:hypothetical protein